MVHDEEGLVAAIHDGYEAIGFDVWGVEAPDIEEFVDVMRDQLHNFLSDADYERYRALDRDEQERLIRKAY